MIDKKDVIRFFDNCAATWDEGMVRSDEIINRILDNARIGKGSRVLDVACGTGVLIPDYLKRQVASVTAVDISPEMIAIARSKFPEENVRFICADVEELPTDEKYDAIMVYNAFPHFPDPDALISHLSALLAPHGTLTVAHGMSREAIDAHHHGSAAGVSNGLMSAEELTHIFSPYTEVTTMISDDSMYQVTGEAVIHEHAHTHTHEHSHSHGEEGEHTHRHTHEHTHEHSHDSEHMDDHGHTHDHEHGHEHTHDHEHGHEHTHDHGHDHGIPMDVLLQHYLEHNRSHIEELEQIAEQLDGVAKDCLIKAIGTLELGCDQLDEALNEMRLDMD